MFASVVLIFVLKFPDGIQNLISSLSNGESSLLPPWVCGGSGCQGVDLTDGEPGEGAEHKVEKVLTNVDHDVLILKDSLLNNLPEEKKNYWR